MSNYKIKLNNIKTFIFDVDGVFTESKLTIMPDGGFLRNMNAKDGYALLSAVLSGYKIAIITGGVDEIIKKRYQKFGIKDIYLGSINKIEDYKDFIQKYDLNPEEIAYMGDDIPDMEVMFQVGLSCCPLDAVQEVRSIADYVSPLKGGEGCVRDLIQQTLRTQGKWYVPKKPVLEIKG